jgi:hypothetical protein
MSDLQFAVFSSNPANKSAIVFVHGFTGDLRKTWRHIPELLRADGRLNDWDMVSFGYASNRLFDLTGLWAADGDLESIAQMLNSRPELARRDRGGKYDRLVLVAHSMGGLVVQQAIVSYPDLRSRLSHVILFGTPSNGLEKAGFLDFWKRQIKNMETGGKFITALRDKWSNQNLTQGGSFKFVAVAGERDQFVPPESSQSCFPKEVCRTIPGNHVTMLDGDTPETPAVQTILQVLCGGEQNRKYSENVGLEQMGFYDLIRRLWPAYFDDRNGPAPKLDAATEVAMALEKIGDGETAIRLLQSQSSSGTDALGVLAGRLKRRWWLKSDPDDWARAVELYSEGYTKSTAGSVNHDQAYFHGTNLAYLALAPNHDFPKAKQWAQKVLDHVKNASDPSMRIWQLATEGDAHFILGNKDEGLRKHQASAKQDLKPWQALSMEEQAIRVADLCGLSKDEIQKLGEWYEAGRGTVSSTAGAGQ